MTDRNDWESARKFDNTPNARRLEGLWAFDADLAFVEACCVRLIEDREVVLAPDEAEEPADEVSYRRRETLGEDPAYQRALWGAALVTLFSWYGGTQTEVTELMDEVRDLAEDGPEVFGNWRTQRDKRIAHAVGEDVHVAVGVIVPRDPDGPWGVAHLAAHPLGGTNELHRTLLLQYVRVLRRQLQERVKQAGDNLILEAKFKGHEYMRSLPPAGIRPGSGGLGRPPGAGAASPERAEEPDS